MKGAMIAQSLGQIDPTVEELISRETKART
jgi:hypothetical protein